MWVNCRQSGERGHLMKKLLKHYLITVIFSFAGVILPFLLPLPFHLDEWKYSLLLAMLMAPLAALYLLRRGSSLKMRILLVLLNPAVIYMGIYLYMLIWSILCPEEFVLSFDGLG